jgi:hypothetical protein
MPSPEAVSAVRLQARLLPGRGQRPKVQAVRDAGRGSAQRNAIYPCFVAAGIALVLRAVASACCSLQHVVRVVPERVGADCKTALSQAYTTLQAGPLHFHLQVGVLQGCSARVLAFRVGRHASWHPLAATGCSTRIHLASSSTIRILLTLPAKLGLWPLRHLLPSAPALPLTPRFRAC